MPSQTPIISAFYVVSISLIKTNHKSLQFGTLLGPHEPQNSTVDYTSPQIERIGVKICVYKAHTNITARVGFLYFIKLFVVYFSIKAKVSHSNNWFFF